MLIVGRQLDRLLARSSDRNIKTLLQEMPDDTIDNMLMSERFVKEKIFDEKDKRTTHFNIKLELVYRGFLGMKHFVSASHPELNAEFVASEVFTYFKDNHYDYIYSFRLILYPMHEENGQIFYEQPFSIVFTRRA